MRSALVVGLMLLLAACGRSPTNYVGIPGDNDPHDGVRRAWGLPIQGLDVARYQGRIDFGSARAGGVHFVYIKSTEGKDYIDPNFYDNWRGAQASGMARGAYHFMTWCSLASEQAAWFVRMVPNDPDALPPVLDLEWNNHSSCKNKHNRDDILEKVRVMLDAMERHTGKVPIIYTDMNFYRDILAGEHFDSSFWLRSTAAEPHMKYGDRPWLIWQWTQTGTMSGINTEVDRNAFYGSETEWVQFLLTGCDPRMLDRLGPQGRCGSLK
ncbi:GH25 family lysozyme [Devosia sp.]|uniref:glycoside hydrolase family 25 protein n=1 Tax=Devosia sp. TaxID=1871048 RepID=UPI0025C30EE5|nr:GH25 family lysozyme [Devosia sp.]